MRQQALKSPIESMISQIRIYTINKGEMDNFLKHFKDDIMVLHEKIGVPIVGT